MRPGRRGQIVQSMSYVLCLVCLCSVSYFIVCLLMFSCSMCYMFDIFTYHVFSSLWFVCCLFHLLCVSPRADPSENGDIENPSRAPGDNLH